MNGNNLSEKIKAVILGHAVADALGVPVEFSSRDDLERDPVTDMRGFGTYPYPAGCWSDDTSMSLAALDSLASGRIDWEDIMRRLGLWYTSGEYTPTGTLFDIGNTCANAICKYLNCGVPAVECGENGANSNGNGSLMRIHPFALYAFAAKKRVREAVEMIHTASSLTHSHRRSLVGCGIYYFVLTELLKRPEKSSVGVGLCAAEEYYNGSGELEYYSSLFCDGFERTERSDIRSGGYVVDTLEAALWCLLNSDSYAECVLMAVNLGEDTDTVAAVAGGLAGALYGYGCIPEEWLSQLKRRDYIEKMCEAAALVWNKE